MSRNRVHIASVIVGLASQFVFNASLAESLAVYLFMVMLLSLTVPKEPSHGRN